MGIAAWYKPRLKALLYANWLLRVNGLTWCKCCTGLTLLSADILMPQVVCGPYSQGPIHGPLAAVAPCQQSAGLLSSLDHSDAHLVSCAWHQP